MLLSMKEMRATGFYPGRELKREKSSSGGIYDEEER